MEYLSEMTSTVRAVTNRFWAIWRLVSPWAASSAMRRSLAVSASSPVSKARPGLAAGLLLVRALGRSLAGLVLA
jgi:hypothetical protein